MLNFKRQSRLGRELIITGLLLSAGNMVWGEAAGHSSGKLHTQCSDWATIDLGHYQLNNDVWGKRGLVGYSQCIYKIPGSNGDSTGRFGWYWHWPRAFDGVKSYPSVFYGRDLWSQHATTKALPKAIFRLRHIYVNYKIKSRHTGAVNLLLESWITRNARPRHGDRLGELAIQLSQIKWPGQEGKYIENVKIDGINFAFYLAKKTHAPGDHDRWAYYGFVHKPQTLLNARVDIMQFVKYLVRKGYVDRRSYIATVELGNEIDHGKGRTQVEHYSVIVQ